MRKLVKGDFVVRGPHWTWENQDRSSITGKRMVGRVLDDVSYEYDTPRDWFDPYLNVRVEWEDGSKNSYAHFPLGDHMDVISVYDADMNGFKE